ncbi:MAG: thiamine phosphate synthase [Desulfatibacillum sp.]|nr:thiamine phosphate synthase [Desulfatibacillum sp.]
MDDAYGLYLVLTNPLMGYEACTRAAVRQGVRFVQLRMKNTPEDQILKKAKALREITRGSNTLFIVNDHVHIAREVDADGVHLGQDDMSLDVARSLWPDSGKIFGLSTHGVDQELSARSLKPDYIGVGPVFSTPTKEKPDPTMGLETVGRIITSSPLSCVAIGGIDQENLPRVLAHGAKNFAVVRAVNQAADPEEAIRGLMEIWRNFHS